MKAIEQKREALKRAYSGVRWRERVDKMKDDEVVAIFLRLKQQNKL